MGEQKNEPLRVQSELQVRLDFMGSKITRELVVGRRVDDLTPQKESNRCARIAAVGAQGKGLLVMPSKRHTPEQIISKLRKAEVLLSQPAMIAMTTNNSMNVKPRRPILRPLSAAGPISA